MPGFKDIFVTKSLLPVEYEQLTKKGYLKLKADLSEEHLRVFEDQYHVGDQFVFQSPFSNEIQTKISSLDKEGPHAGLYKVYIGFTLT